jgi:hypothetical protein
MARPGLRTVRERVETGCFWLSPIGPQEQQNQLLSTGLDRGLRTMCQNPTNPEPADMAGKRTASAYWGAVYTRQLRAAFPRRRPRDADRSGSTREAESRVLARFCPTPRELGRSVQPSWHRSRAAASVQGSRARRDCRVRPVERSSPCHRVPSRPRPGTSCTGRAHLPRGGSAQAALHPPSSRSSALGGPGARWLVPRLVPRNGERVRCAPARPSRLSTALGSGNRTRLRVARRARYLQRFHCPGASRRGLAGPKVADRELLVRCGVSKELRRRRPDMTRGSGRAESTAAPISRPRPRREWKASAGL